MTGRCDLAGIVENRRRAMPTGSCCRNAWSGGSVSGTGDDSVNQILDVLIVLMTVESLTAGWWPY